LDGRRSRNPRAFRPGSFKQRLQISHPKGPGFNPTILMKKDAKNDIIKFSALTAAMLTLTFAVLFALDTVIGMSRDAYDGFAEWMGKPKPTMADTSRVLGAGGKDKRSSDDDASYKQEPDPHFVLGSK